MGGQLAKLSRILKPLIASSPYVDVLRKVDRTEHTYK